MSRILLWSGLATLVGCAAYVLLSASKQQADRRKSDNERLDDALDDSFPASDPPAHRTVTAAGGPLHRHQPW